MEAPLYCFETHRRLASVETITPAPLITDVVTAGSEFDLPCRFNSRIDIQHVSPDLREAGAIDIIELVTP